MYTNKKHVAVDKCAIKYVGTYCYYPFYNNIINIMYAYAQHDRDGPVSRRICVRVKVKLRQRRSPPEKKPNWLIGSFRLTAVARTTHHAHTAPPPVGVGLFPVLFQSGFFQQRLRKSRRANTHYGVKLQ